MASNSTATKPSSPPATKPIDSRGARSASSSSPSNSATSSSPAGSSPNGTAPPKKKGSLKFKHVARLFGFMKKKRGDPGFVEGVDDVDSPEPEEDNTTTQPDEDVQEAINDVITAVEATPAPAPAPAPEPAPAPAPAPEPEPIVEEKPKIIPATDKDMDELKAKMIELQLKRQELAASQSRISSLQASIAKCKQQISLFPSTPEEVMSSEELTQLRTEYASVISTDDKTGDHVDLARTLRDEIMELQTQLTRSNNEYKAVEAEMVVSKHTLEMMKEDKSTLLLVLGQIQEACNDTKLKRGLPLNTVNEADDENPCLETEVEEEQGALSCIGHSLLRTLIIIDPHYQAKEK